MTTTPKCYTRRQVIDLLHLKDRTFERMKKAGELPMVEELLPVLRRHKLYRADLLDRYLAGEWGQSRFLSSHKRGAPRTRPTTLAVTP